MPIYLLTGNPRTVTVVNKLAYGYAAAALTNIQGHSPSRQAPREATNRATRNLVGAVQVEDAHELADVLRVAGTGGERLHCEQVLGRGGEHAKTGMVEHPGGRRVSTWRHVGAGLLVQPPPGQPQLSRHSQCFIVHDAMRLEQRINVASGPTRIVREGHRSPAEYIQVSHDATPSEPVAKAAEGILDARPVEQRRRIGHAASIS
jgi:hypothetical protein